MVVTVRLVVIGEQDEESSVRGKKGLVLSSRKSGKLLSPQKSKNEKVEKGGYKI